MDERIVRPDVDREVDEEFEHHLAMRVRDLVARGWTEEEARTEAIRRFGDVERVKADCRELGTRRNVMRNRRLRWDELRQDLSYAVRQLRRAPSFAAIAVLTLGIAIGANTAVFSVVNGVVLKALPFPAADELAVVWTRYLPPSGFDIAKFTLSGPEFLDVREESRALQSLGAFQVTSRTLTGDGADAERVRMGLYSPEVLPTLGVPAALGRWFTPEEVVPGGPALTVLSHRLWVGRLGADPTIVGRSVIMNGISTEVVGVMPEGFEFPSDTEAWAPLALDRTNEGIRAGHSYSAIGRLAPDATFADLDAELEVFKERWAEAYEHNVAHYAWSQDLRTELIGDAPTVLRLLMAAVALVLLVACANVANLLLARAERRQAEVAVRSTLGAGRGRITRQLATESLVLAAAAAALGLVLARVGVRALIALDPDAMPRLDDVGLDGPVLLFTLGVTLVTALLFGIAPAYLAGRRASPALASAATRAVGGTRRASLRRVLVSGEVAVSLVVVILAGLVVRGYSELTGTDPRMNTENLLTFYISLPVSGYPNDATIPDDFERLLDQLRALPTVTTASGATSLPFGGTSQMWDFELDDRPPRAEGDVAWNAAVTHVATDYFETTGIPILAGRDLSAADARGAPLVAVVSEALARRYWPGQNVLGKRIGYQKADTVPWMTIVGLVPDPVTATLDGEPYPHLYVPELQGGLSTYFVPRGLQVAVRSAADLDALVPAVRRAVADFDADLALYRLSTMEDIVSDSLSAPRMTTNLLGVFALIALVLATVGIYGVISYSVAGRTREIGVRVALGAERRQISRMILSEGSKPVVVGVVVGLGAAWFATSLVESMLHGIRATDPLTFSVLPVVLLLVGLMASWIPAARATRIAPTEALRED